MAKTKQEETKDRDRIVEIENKIQRLQNSPFVRLARRADAFREQRMAVLMELQRLEMRGRALAASGIDEDYMNSVMRGDDS